MNNKDFHEWVAEGVHNGWVGPPVCYTHDGLPTTPHEDEMLFEEDVCVLIIRVYADSDEATLVEENHSPSRWRNRY